MISSTQAGTCSSTHEMLAASFFVGITRETEVVLAATVASKERSSTKSWPVDEAAAPFAGRWAGKAWPGVMDTIPPWSGGATRTRQPDHSEDGPMAVQRCAKPVADDGRGPRGTGHHHI
jgi:hypothetical protein